MAALTREQERLHAQACELVELDRPLTEDERWFVLEHWRASSTAHSGLDGAHFTPAGLAVDMALQVSGSRIIDLAAGIGRLAFHNRDAGGRWPHGGPEFVCIERNREYVRVGQRVMPEARWICADIMDIPGMLEDLGEFDCAISNPPFGPIHRSGNAPGGYRGRRFEYHAIALAALVARRGVFIIPQIAAPFRCSGVHGFESGTGDGEYERFVAATGIELKPNCGIDATYHDDDWDDVPPVLEVVCADFTKRREAVASPAAADQQGGQLSLLSP